jgi:hypothetical protein
VTALSWIRELRTNRPFRRAGLRRVAVRFARHGWDVLPGAYRVDDRFECDRPGCRTVSCHPAVADWEAAASHDPRQVATWWADRPHSVLLATGRAFDALEVPALLGRQVAATAEGPVASGPDDRWLLLVRPGEGLRPELQAQCVLHGLGSWIVAPPSPQAAGRMRWEVTPQECDWRLPEPYRVQQSVVSALQSLGGVRPLRARRPASLPIAA